MINIDICCCTYNSAKWLNGFFDAVCNVNYDKKKLHIYFTDNLSTDDTVEQLQKIKGKTSSQFGDFEIIQSGYNAGFGVGSNMSARAGSSEIVFFYNVDTAIEPDAFAILSNEVEKSDSSTGAFEMRQLPYEHPKYYNPVTLETSWAIGAALAVKREVFEKTGGFDESIFMYCEDVDLSWRIRLAGYTIKYLPSATTLHFIPRPGDMKPTQIAGQLAGERILRLKFAEDAELAKWKEIRRDWQPMLDKNEFAATLAEKLLADIDKNEKEYRRFYNENVKNSGMVFNFEAGYDYTRLGSACPVEKAEKTIGLTVIIRTYNRPGLLALTLQSLCNQTVKSFKVIVVEDGETPVSEATVNSFADRLDIKYIPMRAKVGRCIAGNTALDNVKTGFAVFLNDDDYFFADYIETISLLAQQNPECKMLCSSSAQAEVITHNEDGSLFTIKKTINLSAKGLKRVNFFHDNPVSIQAVVFHISLYRQYGGFDSRLDAFEDWDLWLRYAVNCEIAATEKTLSLFKVPYGRSAVRKKQECINSHKAAFFDKAAQYSAQFTAQDIISLGWTPETVGIYGEEDFDRLKETSLRIVQSKVYRLASSFIKLFSGLSRFFAKTAEFFGPEKLDDNEENYGNIQQFVIRAQDAPFMKKLTGILNNIKK